MRERALAALPFTNNKLAHSPSALDLTPDLFISAAGHCGDRRPWLRLRITGYGDQLATGGAEELSGAFVSLGWTRQCTWHRSRRFNADSKLARNRWDSSK